VRDDERSSERCKQALASGFLYRRRRQELFLVGLAAAASWRAETGRSFLSGFSYSNACDGRPQRISRSWPGSCFEKPSLLRQPDGLYAAPKGASAARFRLVLKIDQAACGC
jgi:hypothetical protein